MNNTPAPHPDHPDVVRLRKLAHRMESAVRLPLVGWRVGWDSIIGLVPVIGDTLTMLPAAFIIKEARRMGASPYLLGRMGFNVGVDLAIGAIPLIGDIFDIGWKANTRNVAMLEDHLKAQNGAVNPAEINQM